MANWDEIRTEWETSKITLTALAEKHGVKLGTLKSRKSREGWSRDGPSKKDATKSAKVAAISKKDATRKRGAPKGNKNAAGNNGGAPKRNQNAVKHGFFAKFLPEETLEIMDAMNDFSAADLIWDQIKIQYAAIIRAQRIMFVEDKDEMIKELKKEKEFSSESGGGSETEWELQFAWDRHATFLNAQSRAMGELRSLIKQFNDLAHEQDERRLKLEQMQLNIAKTKAEIDNMNDDESDDTVNIVITRKGARD